MADRFNILDRGSAALVPVAITPGASPYTYTNAYAYPVDVVVSGGTVTTIEISRDGSTWYLAGLLVGLFHLSAGDRLKVTYAVVPTMTAIPR